MNRLQRVIISISVLTLLVVTIALGASIVFKPHENTPIKKVLPAKTSTISLPQNKIIAAWIWKYPTELVNDSPKMLDFAKNEGINTVYLYIDEFVDIYETSDPKEKSQKMDTYLKAVKTILKNAKDRNISVQAMSGNTAYSYDSHSYIPPIIINHIFEFNKENPNTPFSGIQFDIEFYDDPRFFGSTKEYTDEFLKLVSSLSDQTQKLNKETSQNISLGFVVPFWFDEPNDYFGDPIFPQIVSELSKSPNSYVVVMAYRNNPDDVLKISEGELKNAQENNIGIIIAQEITRNKDEKITYFGKGRDEIKKSLLEVMEKANTYSSFKGISIHDLPAFTETF